MHDIDVECEREDCVFTFGAMSTTAVYFPPRYNKQGENLNPDGNVTSGKMICETCGKKWKYIRQYGEERYVPIEEK